jgi:signal transduction histidine kinase
VDATLLRIAQGSLANVLRHSDAARGEVTLSYLGDEVALDVVDDGIGFDPKAAQREEVDGIAFGLRAMRQRRERRAGRSRSSPRRARAPPVSVRIPLEAP